MELASFHRVIGVGKEGADIAHGGSTEQGVDERMGDRVTV